MITIRIISFLMIFVSVEAISCSPLSSNVFEPDSNEYKWHTDDKTGYVVKPPRLKVVSVEVKRGMGSDGFSCIDAGSLEVTVAMQTGSPYTFDEVGVYLKVKNVLSGDNVLIGHQYPLAPFEKDKNKATFVVAWLDGAPKNQSDIDMLVEAFVLTHNLEIGPSVEFKIKSMPGG